jgi:hypothetical protein
MDDDRDDDPIDDLEEEPTYPCPGCGVQVYEEADACPYCGEYLAWDDPHLADGGGKPWWVWLGAVVALITMALMVLALVL